jgi:hypothetical protein
MKNKKKAQIEISFNWVFVLIAGAAILFFFVRIINSEIGISQDISQKRAIQQMNAVMSALQQNPDSVRVEDAINYDINFECTIEGHIYGIRNAREPLPHQVIFTPNRIGNSRLIAWVRMINTPFPVTSTLYLTDELTKYVFLSDLDDSNNYNVKRYYDLFPNNITKEYIDLQTFSGRPHEGYENYILIMNKDLENEGFSFQDRGIRDRISQIIAINQNKITFYEIGTFPEAVLNELKELDYFTQELAIGAIITGNYELYECTLEKILEQTRIAADINKERIASIYDEYEGHRCDTNYGIIVQNYFEELSNAARTQDFDEIRNNIVAIRAVNNRIIRDGCVQIY